MSRGGGVNLSALAGAVQVGQRPRGVVARQFASDPILEVPLTRGLVAIIDADDAWILQWKWHASWRGKHVYAARTERTGVGERKEHFLLHRVLLGEKCVGFRVDHADGDTLNCRRKNLRPVPQKNNTRNRCAATGRNRTSGVLGVSRTKSGSWTAFIRDGGGSIYLGNFTTLEAAAVARAREEVRRWGIEPRRAAELSGWLESGIDPEQFRASPNRRSRSARRALDALKSGAVG